MVFVNTGCLKSRGISTGQAFMEKGIGNSAPCGQLRLLQCKGDAMLGFDGHAHGQTTMMLVSDDGSQ